MIVRDSHQSGRFDAKPAERVTMLEGIADAATVGVVTEAVGLDMLDGWKSSGHETKVIWDDAIWELVNHGTESIATTEWKRGTSRRKSVEITWALLRHRKTGLLLLRLGGHLPAHLFRAAQLAANKAALDALAGIILALVARFSPDLITLSMDANRNMRRKPQRRIVREALQGTGLHLVVPPEGTRGRAKIDVAATSSALFLAAMFAEVVGFDHTGFEVDSCGCPSA